MHKRYLVKISRSTGQRRNFDFPRRRQWPTTNEICRGHMQFAANIQYEQLSRAPLGAYLRHCRYLLHIRENPIFPIAIS